MEHGIESGTQGDYLIKSAHFDYKKTKAQQAVELPHLPMLDAHSQFFVLQDTQGRPRGNQPYRLKFKGQPLTGRTSAQGHTRTLYSEAPEALEASSQVAAAASEYLRASYWDAASAARLDFAQADEAKKDNA